MKTTSRKTQKAGAQNRPEQVSTKANAETKREPLAPIDLERRKVNRMLETNQLLAILEHDAPRLFDLAQVVGAWVWIEFSERQPSTVTSELSQLGFHWNKRRTCWQHPCGKFSDRTFNDPRVKYGSYYPATA